MTLCCGCAREFSAASDRTLPKRISCGHSFCLSCLERLSASKTGCCPVDGEPINVGKPSLLPTDVLALHTLSSSPSALHSVVLACPLHGTDVSKPVTYISLRSGFGLCTPCATAKQTTPGFYGELVALDACSSVLKSRIASIKPAVESTVTQLKDQRSRLGAVADEYVQGVVAAATEMDTFFGDSAKALTAMKSTMRKTLSQEGQLSQKVPLSWLPFTI